jgi:predicted transcriptional regulator
MARPRHENPTPAELEVLHILWRTGPATVRDMMDELNRGRARARAYTTVMSLLNIMADKGLVRRRRKGRAFVYQAKVTREKTLRRIIGDVVDRAFEGSASALVANLLDQARPDREELEDIGRTIAEYRRQKETGR